MAARESGWRPANVTTDTVSVVLTTYGVLTSIWTMATLVIQFTVIIINIFFITCFLYQFQRMWEESKNLKHLRKQAVKRVSCLLNNKELIIIYEDNYE